MSACPICQKPVDPLRSRFVSVRGVQVVAFCSAECLAKANAAAGSPSLSAPAKAAPQPQAVPIVAVPAAPVVPKAAVTPTATPKSKASDFDSGPVIEIVHEPVSGVVTSAPDPRDSAPALESGAVRKRDPRDVLGEEDDDDELDETPDGANEAGGTMRRRRDSFSVKQAEDWLDDEPAEPVRPATAPPFGLEEERSGGRGFFIALLVLALLGAGGYALYKYVYLPRTAAQAKQAPLDPPKTPVVDAAVVPQEPLAKTALDRATKLLETYMQSKESPRLQRSAAIVLSRTGNAAAKERLAAALDKDNLDPPGKLEVAFALARAGDKRGLDLLVKLLASEKRDDKLAGAQRLAWLGDERAKDVLAGFLAIQQNRLGAAKELGRFKDERAVKVLEEIRAQGSPDDKLDATIALVVAGNRGLARELHPMLENKHFNIAAAEALAGLGDATARPVLATQLESTGIRVRAARALRRLDPTFDMTPYLTKLVAMLDDPALAKDTEQIPVAEAILLLAGDPSWAAKP
jgi:HEAT repeat protein